MTRTIPRETAMAALDPLIACAGRWNGSSRLRNPETDTDEESPSAAVVVPMLGDRFVRIDYTWSYHDKPQEGSILFGYDPGADAFSAHWIDSWHLGHAVMACSRPRSGHSPLAVRGSYAAPPGPDWGWRIEVLPGGDEFRLLMFNISPEGREELAVEALYTPG